MSEEEVINVDEEKNKLEVNLSLIIFGLSVFIFYYLFGLLYTCCDLLIGTVGFGHLRSFYTRFHCYLPLIQIIPSISIGAGIFKKIDKTSLRTKVIVSVVLLLLIIQPARIRISSEVTGPTFTPEEISRKIKKGISIEFRLVKKSPSENTITKIMKDTGEKLHLSKNVSLTLQDIETAIPNQHYLNSTYNVHLLLNEEGAKKINQLTKNNIGRRVGIIVDGELVCAPTIQDEIRDNNANIAGRFTESQAKDISKRINNP